jgi:peptide/nickel transport system ATP-binding protein
VPLLDVRNLNVQFPTARGEWLTAVHDVSFSVERGKTLGLVGESGSGKSVTSLAIMGLLPPQARVQGNILLEDEDLLTFSDERLRDVRGARISMIFQEPMTALNPVMRVGDQIAEAVMAHTSGQRPEGDGQPVGAGGRARDKAQGPSTSSLRDSARDDRLRGPAGDDSVHGSGRAIGSNGHLTKAEAWNLALTAMQDVGIPEHERRARDYPHQLSGGQRQRIMIAMAIVNRPELLIADEPTTALDVTIQAQILDLLAELRGKFRLAMMFISHDLAVVSQVSDHIAVMYSGSIVETGPASAVFHQPAHPYTIGLLHAVPSLTTPRDRRLQTIDGTVPALTALPPGCRFAPRCSRADDACTHKLPDLIEVGPAHCARCIHTENAGSTQ